MFRPVGDVPTHADDTGHSSVLVGHAGPVELVSDPTALLGQVRRLPGFDAVVGEHRRDRLDDPGTILLSDELHRIHLGDLRVGVAHQLRYPIAPADQFALIVDGEKHVRDGPENALDERLLLGEFALALVPVGDVPDDADGTLSLPVGVQQRDV